MSVRPACRATRLSTLDQAAALKLRLTRLSRAPGFVAGAPNESEAGASGSAAIRNEGRPPARTVPAKRPAARRRPTARLQAISPALRWSLVILVPPVTRGDLDRHVA